LSSINQELFTFSVRPILNTGIPAVYKWWSEIANKEEKIKYLRLALSGDFTYERSYIEVDRKWICSQFATQLVINFLGPVELVATGRIEDIDLFRQYGYVIPEVGYGIPNFYTQVNFFSYSHAYNAHAYNAVFVGDNNLFGETGEPTGAAKNVKNWVIIEPQISESIRNIPKYKVEIHIDRPLAPDHVQNGKKDRKIFLSNPEFIAVVTNE